MRTWIDPDYKKSKFSVVNALISYWRVISWYWKTTISRLPIRCKYFLKKLRKSSTTPQIHLVNCAMFEWQWRSELWVAPPFLLNALNPSLREERGHNTKQLFWYTSLTQFTQPMQLNATHQASAKWGLFSKRKNTNCLGTYFKTRSLGALRLLDGGPSGLLTSSFWRSSRVTHASVLLTQ